MLKTVAIKRLLLCLLSFVITACGQADDAPLLLQGETMGTFYTIKIMRPEASFNESSVQLDIDRLLADINASMSNYDDNSELSQLNRNAGSACLPISAQLSKVLEAALNISDMTDGRFDVTIQPLVTLWGFGPEGIPLRIPSDSEIERVQNSIGYDKLTLAEDGACISKQQPEVHIDLSAIAKGYAVDQVAELLQSYGIADYMIEIGGEIKAKGLNQSNIPWQIGIEKPLSGQRSVQKIIALKNIGLATSGDYRNYFEHDGTRYSHLIDADTGRPIRHKLVSVTVLHESVMIADALATAFMVMGFEQAEQLAEEQELAAYFILRKDAAFVEAWSDHFNQYSKH